MIQIYNSMSQKIETFEPLNKGEVKMYCCGPTVYGLLHVGNFRGAVFYNFLRNFLEYSGYKVTFVYNFTDVDDKIINRAKEEGLTPHEISEKYIKEFWIDFDRLGLTPHSKNPKVTESMEEIISTIETLIKKGHAYVTSDGDVYYSISSFPDYGKLSNRKIEELQKGVRISLDESKKEPLDFALWKAAKSGEPSWESPWGPGRPGWHIECSAMIHKHLGDQIDIHGGGLDLLFPHHENEVAQSEGAYCKHFVKYWVHNNMIQMNGSKMSKSLGNIITARDFFNRYHPEIYKHMVLSVHYRSILDLGDEAVATSIKLLAKVYSSLNLAHEILSNKNQFPKAQAQDFQSEVERIKAQILEDAAKDFNTALVLTHLYEIIRIFNQKVKRGQKVTAEHVSLSESLIHLFKEIGSLLSLFQEVPSSFLTFLDNLLLEEKGLVRSEIQQKVDLRLEFRRSKNYTEADTIRAELEKLGIMVCDLPSGESYWEVAK
jgi:cysteinyl-tRNA synthetase